jgi:membrane-bound ClpP family serine protease
VLRFAGVGLLVWVGAIHLDLWLGGYRQIPTDGPLFLADAIAGFALAASLLAWPRPLIGLLGTGFMVSTLAGLILSINVGLFGFHESIGASFVVESIVLESIGAVTLVAWTVIVVQAQSKRGPLATRRS